MNLIEEQAKRFALMESLDDSNYHEFILKVRSTLYNYKKDSYKLDFIQQLIREAKAILDEHVLKCTYSSPGKCNREFNYESILFFYSKRLKLSMIA